MSPRSCRPASSGSSACGSRESWPWASVYAAHFLTEAEIAGHSVPEDFRNRLFAYVRKLLDKVDDEGDLLETQAYACYVLALSGKPHRPAMSRLAELASATGPSALPQYAPQRTQAKLYLALANLVAGRRDLAAGLIPKNPPMRLDRQSGGNIGSPIRDRAMLISTLLLVEPENPAIPALVQQLAEAGQKGEWSSTQDCAFSVIALARYLRTFKSESPFETAVLDVDPAPTGKSDVPLALSTRGDVLNYRAAATQPATRPTWGNFAVSLSGTPGSRGYVTWVQTGVPLDGATEIDSVLKIRRRYLDSRGNPIANNTLRTGDLVRVELTVEAPANVQNLVIEDLLPAGLEIENPRLATSFAASGVDPSEPGVDSAAPMIAAPAFELRRTDIRDDRIILVGNMPNHDKIVYQYLARATSPGTFVVPPSRVECMYDISQYSIHGRGTLTVEPRSNK